ncbi:MAG: GNAT family protein, partial [Chloroflexota bacterium]
MIPYPTTLTNGTITLRPVQLDDVSTMTQAVHESIPAIMPWMGWCHPDFSEAEARIWISSLPAAWRAGTQYAFAITDTQDGTFLGGCGLNHINRIYRLANLGYWVRTSAAGRGIATQATRLLARFGIERLNLLRAEIVVAVDNHASLRVAEKCGAAREGVLRNRLIVRGNILDAVMHALGPQD